MRRQSEKIKPWQPPVTQTGLRKVRRSVAIFKDSDFADDIDFDLSEALQRTGDPTLPPDNMDQVITGEIKAYFTEWMDGFDPHAANIDQELIQLEKPQKLKLRAYCMALSQECVRRSQAFGAKEMVDAISESGKQDPQESSSGSEDRLVRMDRAIMRAAHYRFNPPKSSERDPKYKAGAEPPWSSMLTYLRRVDIDEDFAAMPASMDERVFSKAWERVFEKEDPRLKEEDLGEQCMKGILAEQGAYDVPKQEVAILQEIDPGSGLLELTAPQFDKMDSLGGPAVPEPTFSNETTDAQSYEDGLQEDGGNTLDLDPTKEGGLKLGRAILGIILVGCLVSLLLWLLGAFQSV